jgi:ABC-type multidrug transport system ATPase subunit
MSHALKLTTVISLLQPPPEVFNLFDDLMYLCEGRLLYHGPLECAVPHFTATGFICPVRKDVASFLLEITTPTGAIVASTHRSNSNYSQCAEQRPVAVSQTSCHSV